MEKGLGKYTSSFGLSLAVTCLFSALLVVVKELSEHTVLAWMKRVTMHHWVTHALLDLAVFVILGLLFTRVKIEEERLPLLIAGAVAAGGVIVAGFYLIVG